jgi:hypothetical protein
MAVALAIWSYFHRTRLELLAIASARRVAWISGDERRWTELLLREMRLRLRLDGYSPTLTALEGAWRPQDPLANVVAGVLTANLMADRLRLEAFRLEWESLQAARAGEIAGGLGVRKAFRETHGTWAHAFSFRSHLQKTAPAVLMDLASSTDPNDPPPGLRAAARDVLSNLYVDFLCDTTFWQERDFRDLGTLDPQALLRGTDPALPHLDLSNPAIHPLRKVSFILLDLERWHAQAGSRDGAAEALREHERRLRPWFEGKGESRLARAYEDRLSAYRDTPWWSLCMAELAMKSLFSKDRSDPLQAWQLASDGAKQHPGSPGAAPSFRIESRFVSLPGRPSLEVTHRGIQRLYFEARRLDLDRWLASAWSPGWWSGYSAEVPNALYGPDMVGTKQAAESWEVDLDAAPGPAEGRQSLVPKLNRPGLYKLIFSDSADLRDGQGICNSRLLLVSDLFLAVSPGRRDQIEAHVVSGRDGTPVPQAEVALLCNGGSNDVKEVALARSDSNGFAVLKVPEVPCHQRLVVARRRDDRAIVRLGLYSGFWEPERFEQMSVVITPRRSVVSGQEFPWKAVTLGVSGDHARLRPAARISQTVTLKDSRGKTSAEEQGITGPFGSVSGTFEAPFVPASGESQSSELTIGTSVGRGLSPGVFVRPRGPAGPSAILRQPEEPLSPSKRLVRLTGEVRSASGEPITAGTVFWQVQRSAAIASEGISSLLANLQEHGLTSLRPDGTFQIVFVPWPSAELRAKRVRFRVTGRVLLASGDNCGFSQDSFELPSDEAPGQETETGFSRTVEPVRGKVLAERSVLRVGEVARFSVGAPEKGPGLYLETWRRGRRTRTDWLPSSSLPQVLEFPLEEADRGELALRAWRVEDHRFIEATAVVRTDRGLHELIVETSPIPGRTLPGSLFRCTITVKKPDGTPVPSGSAEVLAYLVEKSGGDSGRPNYSFAWWQLGDRIREVEHSSRWTVPGSDPTSRFTNPLPSFPGSLRIRWPFWDQIPGSRGGGAEQWNRLTLPSPLRAGFWLPQLVTEKGGAVDVAAELPRTTGTWDFWVYVIDRDGRSGWLHREIRTMRQPPVP